MEINRRVSMSTDYQMKLTKFTKISIKHVCNLASYECGMPKSFKYATDLNSIKIIFSQSQQKPKITLWQCIQWWLIWRMKRIKIKISFRIRREKSSIQFFPNAWMVLLFIVVGVSLLSRAPSSFEYPDDFPHFFRCQ